METNTKTTKIYKCVSGQWVNVSGDSETLAHALTLLGIIIDDDCQFCRIIRGNKTITYRAYNMAKVTITITENG